MNKILYIWVSCRVQDGKAVCGERVREIEIKKETALNIILVDSTVKHLKHTQLMIADTHHFKKISDWVSYHIYCRPEDKERALEILRIEAGAQIEANYNFAKLIKDAWDSQQKNKSA